MLYGETGFETRGRSASVSNGTRRKNYSFEWGLCFRYLGTVMTLTAVSAVDDFSGIAGRTHCCAEIRLELLGRAERFIMR